MVSRQKARLEALSASAMIDYTFFPQLYWAWPFTLMRVELTSQQQRQKASRWKEIVHKCPFLHHLKICFCSSGGASKMTPNNLLLGGIASRTSCTLHAIIIISLHKLPQRRLDSHSWHHLRLLSMHSKEVGSRHSPLLLILNLLDKNHLQWQLQYHIKMYHQISIFYQKRRSISLCIL